MIKFEVFPGLNSCQDTLSLDLAIKVCPQSACICRSHMGHFILLNHDQQKPFF